MDEFEGLIHTAAEPVRSHQQKSRSKDLYFGATTPLGTR